MADEIKQKIGLDASDALKALDALDKKLDAFGKSLDELAKRMTSFNQVAQAAFAFGDAGKGFKSVGDQAGNMSGKLTQAEAAAKLFGDTVGTASSAAAAGAKQAGAAMSGLGAQAQTGSRTAQSAFRTLATRSVSGLNTLLQKIREVARETARLGTSGAQGFVQNFAIPLQTLGRIIGTQAIVRGINLMSTAMREAVGSAKEFQLQVSEILTISQDSFKTFESVSEAVRGVSDAFNIPLEEAGEGLYQTISNQIQGAASQMAVMESSAKLAKVGVAEFSDSVSLMTGTINAFQLDASDADRVAAVLFKTVEKGRTRISELATSFGTVAPLAKEAGLSFEELAAAFATVTVNGVDTAKAATQLRGIINAFLKPTQAMSDLLQEAGYASGETALQVLGFAGAMDLIQSSTGGSATKLAELIPRVRGLSGAMVLAREEGKKYEQNLKEIIAVTNELIDEKLELRIETGAERLERELNQIKNAFTVDFGQAIVNAAARVSEFLHLGDNMSILIKGLIPLIVGLGAVLLVYGGAAAFAAAKTIVLAGGLTTLTAGLGALPLVIIAGVAAAYGLAKAIEASTKAANDAAIRDATERHAKSLKDERKARNEIVQGTIQQLKDQFNAASKYVADIRAVMAKRVEAWKEANKKIVDDTKKVFDVLLSANKKLVDDLASSRDDALSRAAQAQSNVTSLTQQAADEAFKYENKRYSAMQQTVNLEQRGLQLARQGTDALRKARTDADRDAANAILERAQAFSQEAVSSAETVGNQSLINRTVQSRLGIINQIIAAEEEQVRRQKAAAAELEAKRQQEQKRVNELTKAITEAQNAQAKYNVTADPKDRAAAMKEFQEALKEVNRLAVPEGGLVDAKNFMDYAAFRQNLLDSMVQLEQQGVDVKGTITGDALAKMEQDITTTWAKAIEMGIAKGMEAGLGKEAAREIAFAPPSIETLDQLQQAIIDQKEASIAAVQQEENLKQAAEEFAGGVQAMEAVQNRNTTALEYLGKTLTGLPGTLALVVEGIGRATGIQDETSFDTGVKAKQLQADTKAFVEDLKAVASGDAVLTIDQINERIAEYKRRRDEIANAPQGALKLLDPRIIPDLDQTIQLFNTLVQKMNEAGTLGSEAVRKNAEALQGGGIEQAKQASAEKAQTDQQSQQAVQGAKQATDGQVSALQQGVTATAMMASNAERYRDAMNSAQPPQTATARLGKLLFRASGGFTPRGTDTIPAMLSPGEFVVNARSTKRFFSQLQAINSGRMPVYRQEGGPVSQTNIGDINVTVNGANTNNGSQTGRQIARSLRRELRRNTSQL